MLNHGANHPKYGWKLEKFGSPTANQYSTIARLFRPFYSNTHKEKCQPSKKKTVQPQKTRQESIPIWGWVKTSKKQSLSTQAGASVSPSEFPPVGMGNYGRSPKWPRVLALRYGGKKFGLVG